MNFWSAMAIVLGGYILYGFIYGLVKMRHDQKMALIKLEELKVKLKYDDNEKKETKKKIAVKKHI